MCGLAVIRGKDVYVATEYFPLRVFFFNALFEFAGFRFVLEQNCFIEISVALLVRLPHDYSLPAENPPVRAERLTEYVGVAILARCHGSSPR